MDLFVLIIQHLIEIVRRASTMEIVGKEEEELVVSGRLMSIDRKDRLHADGWNVSIELTKRRPTRQQQEGRLRADGRKDRIDNTRDDSKFREQA